MAVMSLPDLLEDFRAAWYEHKIAKYHRKFRKLDTDYLTRPNVPVKDGSSPLSVGIIGAGPAGLFAALTLERMKAKGLNVTYIILEVQPSNSEVAVGGRLWTHKMPDIDGFPAKTNDYYDRGAMRYPDMPFQLPVMGTKTAAGYQDGLFPFLDMRPVDPRQVQPQSGDLIPYTLNADANPYFFNGVHTTEGYGGAGLHNDPFSTGVADLTGSPDAMLFVGELQQAKYLIVTAMSGLNPDIDAKTWAQLIAMDTYSVRQVLQEQGYSYDKIKYLESLEQGAGMFDQSMLDCVFDSLEFGWPTITQDPIQWYAIQGGSNEMAKRMRAKLQPDSLINSAKVVQIVPVAPGDISSALMVSYQDLAQPTGSPATQLQFDHVINTVPFGALRAIDLSALQLQWPLTSAIRELNYCNSGKIAMRFKERWWEKRYKLVGGFGKTDGPIRVCVYPAYGVKETEGATIIVSYTWDQDANVLGALAASPAALKGAPKDALKDVVFRDLNALHGIEDDKVLPGLFLDMDAWNWADNAGTGGGAFALFGPGQFANAFKHVTMPHGNLHFAGEATSPHHAWVVGAVNSAFRTVAEIIHAAFAPPEARTYMESLTSLWPNIREFDTDTIAKQTALGMRGVFAVPSGKA